jgi:hypothetical protein
MTSSVTSSGAVAAQKKAFPRSATKWEGLNNTPSLDSAPHSEPVVEDEQASSNDSSGTKKD